MSDTAAYETPADAGSGEAGEVRLWLEAITIARKAEETWRKKATDATKRYRDEKERTKLGTQFNILFANVSTTLPAIYNSTPVPDVRRRHSDTDAVGRIAAQVLERSLSYSVDCHDFDGAMKAAVWDMEVSGRGVAWVRYGPTLAGEDGAEEIVAQDVTVDFVDWRDYAHGPGRRWEEVPWVARLHRLTRDQLKKLSPEHGATMPLDIVEEHAKRDDDRDVPDVFKRGTVWEIWDKAGRRVLFVSPEFPTAFLRQEPDPLNLRDFWPLPRPLHSILDPGSLVPLVPYELYKDQAEELDRVTERITRLTAMLKYRGARASELRELDDLANKEDGEFVPVVDWQQFVATTGGGGLDRAMWHVPIEIIRQVIDGLLLHREQIKQVIYEITGLSDILRGATDAAETATAQRIKSQWGSLRIQDRQAEVARFARDLFRIMAEIIAEKFEPQALGAMSGVDLPTAALKQQAQAAVQPGQPPDERIAAILKSPTWEDVLGVLRSDAMRGYRVDIETDSTIQQDVARLQDNAARFVEGFGAYIQAVGPAVQTGQFPAPVAVKIAKAFSRSFKLGREAEDALEEWSSQPPPQQADPNAGAMQQAQMEMQARQAEAQQTAQLEQAKLAQAAEMDRAKIESAERMKMAELQATTALERERMALEQQRHAETMQAERDRADLDAQMRAMEGERSVGLEREKMSLSERQSSEAVRAKAEPAKASADMMRPVAEALSDAVAAMRDAAQSMAVVAEEVSAPRETIMERDPTSGRAVRAVSRRAAREEGAA